MLDTEAPALVDPEVLEICYEVAAEEEQELDSDGSDEGGGWGDGDGRMAAAAAATAAAAAATAAPSAVAVATAAAAASFLRIKSSSTPFARASFGKRSPGVFPFESRAKGSAPLSNKTWTHRSQPSMGLSLSASVAHLPHA